MFAFTGDMDRPAPAAQLRIVTRLQQLRARVHDPFVETADILVGILGVAIAARTEEMRGFTSVCMIVFERIEPLARGGRLSRRMLELIGEWSANSELYLRRPHYVEFAKALVRQLNYSPWGSRLGREEQDRLIRSLLASSW